MWIYAVLLLSIFGGSQCTNNETDCFVKEKSLGVLDLAKDTLEKLKHLLPNCTNDHPSLNTSECGVKEKALALIDIATDLISEAKRNYPNCFDPVTNPVTVTVTEPVTTTDIVTETILPQTKPIDCKDVLEQGNKASGVYKIWPKHETLNGSSIQVYCDMETDGGGWTVIQRRDFNFTRQNFYQEWKVYKKGFGDINGEFWLGNDNIYALTNQSKYKLRFDLEDGSGVKKYALYNSFWIENESALYRIHLADYSGEAGDSMNYENGSVFCTKDKTNGKSFNNVPCAVSRETGWWFDSCNRANINGLPMTGNLEDRKNLYWQNWKGFECLRSASMKIRR